MDRYVLGNRIGQGSFGKVYLAKDRLSNNEQVVVKIVPLPTNKKEREECLREVNYLTKLHHPFLVYCKDSFVDGSRLGIVMPYYSGGDLSSIIKKNAQRHTRLPEEVLREWFAELALSVEHLHSMRIMHRDIKSDNVFMRTTDDRPSSAGAPVKKVSVLLGDFGIARALEYSNANARTTCGTPFYMSPELFKGTPYGFKSDIWGLGCVFYEMMSLKTPFTANSWGALAKAVMNNAPTPLPDTYSGVLRQLVMSMLHKDPSQRPSAQDLLKHPMLRDLVGGLLSRTDPDVANPPAPPPSVPPSAAHRRPGRMPGPSLPEALTKDERSEAVRLSMFSQCSRIGVQQSAASAPPHGIGVQQSAASAPPHGNLPPPRLVPDLPPSREAAARGPAAARPRPSRHQPPAAAQPPTAAQANGMYQPYQPPAMNIDKMDVAGPAKMYPAAGAIPSRRHSALQQPPPPGQAYGRLDQPRDVKVTGQGASPMRRGPLERQLTGKVTQHHPQSHAVLHANPIPPPSRQPSSRRGSSAAGAHYAVGAGGVAAAMRGWR